MGISSTRSSSMAAHATPDGLVPGVSVLSGPRTVVTLSDGGYLRCTSDLILSQSCPTGP